MKSRIREISKSKPIRLGIMKLPVCTTISSTALCRKRFRIHLTVSPPPAVTPIAAGTMARINSWRDLEQKIVKTSQSSVNRTNTQTTHFGKKSQYTYCPILIKNTKVWPPFWEQSKTPPPEVFVCLVNILVEEPIQASDCYVPGTMIKSMSPTDRRRTLFAMLVLSHNPRNVPWV